jgi:hypothetical protein
MEHYYKGLWTEHEYGQDIHHKFSSTNMKKELTNWLQEKQKQNPSK